MKVSSIFNDVLGPVMRGPSSSHNAAAYEIASCLCALLGQPPRRVRFAFDAGGSFAEVYRGHGSDMSFAAGVLGLAIQSPDFPQALHLARAAAIDISFAVERLPDASHPNTVDVEMVGRQGRQLSARAISTGGGAFTITQLDGWPVAISGDAHDVLVVAAGSEVARICAVLAGDGQILAAPGTQQRGGQTLIHVPRAARIGAPGPRRA